MSEDHLIHDRYELAKPYLNEQTKRIILAAEARVIGWGGVNIVSKETGVSRETISRGCKELDESPPTQAAGRIRKPGGGRKKLVETDPTLMSDLDSLIEPWSEPPPRVDNELSNINTWREVHEDDEAALRPRIQDIRSG